MTMAKGLGFGMALVLCLTIFGCSPPSEHLQQQFKENNTLWCQEQTSRVTERDDPQWQNLFETCMETGQIQ